MAPKSPQAQEPELNAVEVARVRSGLSLAPLMAFDPTYKVIFGGALFIENAGGENAGKVPYRASLVAFGTTASSFGLDHTFHTWFGGRWFSRVHVSANNLYVPYYGEGNRTRAADRIQIGTRWAEAVAALGYRLTREASVTVFPELSYREETGVNGDLSARVFGRDFTPALGMSLGWDTRDAECDPRAGEHYVLEFRGGARGWSNRQNPGDFVQAELDLRRYFSVTENGALAFQGLISATLGDAGYLYRYSLGSDRLMRGVSSNRYRGDHAYAIQSEWRYRASSWISLNAFASLGDVADQTFSDFGVPKWAVGPGLRIALPPDRIAKLRLDFGIARDETAFYINFNEAF